MSISDELNSLGALHERGLLSDEEFAKAKARLLAGDSTAGADSPLAAINSFRRSRADRWIAGVCGGLARATGVESWVVRLVAAALLLFGGAGALLYVLLWIFVPSE